MRHIVSINTLGLDELRYIIDRSVYFSDNYSHCEKTLANKIVGIYFKKTSTRTRTGFSSGALRLGAQIIAYGPNDLQLNTGESLSDTGAIFSQMLDCLVARTAEKQEDLLLLSGNSTMSVINAMSEEEHPTQALTDLAMVKSHFGTVEGKQLLYVGEGNNTAAALALAMTRFEGCRIQFRTPQGYGLTRAILDQAETNAHLHGSRIEEFHHMNDIPDSFDAVYTTRWQTTGTSKPDAHWRDLFEPFRVDDRIMEKCPKAVFMHDLPAHRGEEVTSSVIDGPRSLAFQQSKFKLYSAMASLEWCMAESAPRPSQPHET